MSAITKSVRGRRVTTASRPKVMIVINTAWNIYNFRAGLIRALVDAGYEVVAVAPPDAFISQLQALGCRFAALPMKAHGKSLIGELALVYRFWRVLRDEQPDAYLGYTVKPNTYGSAMAALLGVKVINNVSGLGTAFLHGGLLTLLVQGLYKLGLYGSKRVFFQNKDDLALFVAKRLVRPTQAALLPGSGIDLKRFAPGVKLFNATPLDKTSVAGERDADRKNAEELRFLLLARLLHEKGVVEFVEAARSLKDQFPDARFQLLGFLDAANPSAITPAMLHAWVDEGVVEYLGSTDDVRPFLAAADCVVLPSYREGTSRALLEAAAMGRPLIVSDVPGCREVVDPDVSGLICNAKDARSLGDKLAQFAKFSSAERAAMGAAGRRKMEKEYDEKFVIDAYLTELASHGFVLLPKVRVGNVNSQPRDEVSRLGTL